MAATLPATQHQTQAAGLPTPHGWTDHFPASEFRHPDSCRAQLVKDVLACLAAEEGVRLLSDIKWLPESRSIVCQLDYPLLVNLCQSEVKAAVTCEPTVALQCISIAITEHLLSQQQDLTRSLLEHDAVESYQPHVKVRLKNVVDALTGIKQLRSSSIGNFVSLQGIVVRMSPVRPLVTGMPFTCLKCGTVQEVEFTEGRFTPPGSCTGKGCKAKTFEPSSANVRCVEWQKLRLQEVVAPDKQMEGQVPRTVDVELTDDLVNSAMVGDMITVYGQVKVLATDETGGSRSNNKQQSLFLIYLEALSIHNGNRAADSSDDNSHIPGNAVIQAPGTRLRCLDPSCTTAQTLDFIIKFTETCEEQGGDQFRQLVMALCPNVPGQELVKAGLVLALMGGVRKNENAPGRVPIRGGVHVLLVGDPGQGKSKLLQAAANVAPRGAYVCGAAGVKAGLSVTMVKDAVSGNTVFEAGAAVQTDGGVCCIDDWDKLSNEHPALAEIMEHQQVAVCKDGLQALQPANTAIFAAAAPKEGHYNKAKSVAENLKISQAMLARFDLTFIMLDKPDEAMDQCMSEHVLSMYAGPAYSGNGMKQKLASIASRVAEQLHGSRPQGGFQSERPTTRQPLADRLKMRAGEDVDDLLPPVLIKKYIAYARQYVQPVLCDEAKAALKDFYFSLKAQSVNSSSGVTTRMLESMLRLTEARARLDLKQEATLEHAQDVIEIMKEALYDNFGGLDDLQLGCVDYRAAGAGSKARGKAAESNRFLARLRTVGGRQGRDTFSSGELYAIATDINLQVKDIGSFIEALNESGELLKSGPGQYRVRGLKATGSSEQGATQNPASQQVPSSQQLLPSQQPQQDSQWMSAQGSQQVASQQVPACVRPRYASQPTSQAFQRSIANADHELMLDVSNRKVNPSQNPFSIDSQLRNNNVGIPRHGIENRPPPRGNTFL